MKKKIVFMIGLLALLTSYETPVYAGRGGAYFGTFAGGAVLGGLIGSSIAKRRDRRYSRRPYYYEEGRPVYVERTYATDDAAAAEIERLRRENEQLRRQRGYRRGNRRFQNRPIQVRS